MTTRRALRTIIASTLALPPAAVFEAVRHVADLIPADAPRGPHGSKAPTPAAAAFHMLAAMATLPRHGAVNRWPPEGRGPGIRARVQRWAALMPIQGRTTITGQPPAAAVAIAGTGLPLIDVLTRLIAGLTTAELLDAVQGGDGETGPGVFLALHGGDHATVRFRFRDGATLTTKYRHPIDEQHDEPGLAVRYGLATKALIRLAAVTLGVPDADAPEWGTLPPGAIPMQADGSMPPGFTLAAAPPGIQPPEFVRQPRPPAPPTRFLRAPHPDETPEARSEREAHNELVRAEHQARPVVRRRYQPGDFDRMGRRNEGQS